MNQRVKAYFIIYVSATTWKGQNNLIYCFQSPKCIILLKVNRFRTLGII